MTASNDGSCSAFHLEVKLKGGPCASSTPGSALQVLAHLKGDRCIRVKLELKVVLTASVVVNEPV